VAPKMKRIGREISKRIRGAHAACSRLLVGPRGDPAGISCLCFQKKFYINRLIYIYNTLRIYSLFFT
jgi:hypothetical protein